jgi:hypothetical protein
VTEPDTVHVKVISAAVPYGRATCEHGRTVLYNLAVGFVVHDDAELSPCDGDLLKMVTQ